VQGLWWAQVGDTAFDNFGAAVNGIFGTNFAEVSAAGGSGSNTKAATGRHLLS